MARVARIVIPSEPHHATQRGNNRQDVFFVDEDRRVYLGLLKEESEKHGFEIDAYCLMTNHVHVVGRPEKETSLAKALGRTHWRYTQYVNRLHGRSGHLWQNRFYSCALDEAHLWAALKYVERNPVRAKLVRKPWRYPWSSAAAHTGADDAAGLLDLEQWYSMVSESEWRETLVEAEEEEMVSALRAKTHTGRPLGSDSFLSKLERTLGRRLRPLPHGRPRKEARKR